MTITFTFSADCTMVDVDKVPDTERIMQEIERLLLEEMEIEATVTDIEMNTQEDE